MSDKYKISDAFSAHFITMTIAEWVDVFSRNKQKLAMIDSLNYCRENKGLTIFAQLARTCCPCFSINMCFIMNMYKP